MIICITGVFDVYERGIFKEKRFMVSHGIDSNTGKTVILPNEHPAKLGAIIDSEYNEWVIHDSNTKDSNQS